MKPDLKNTVSCFKDYKTAGNPRSISLLTWLKSDKYADRVEQIRTIEDKEKRDELKATLPAITPSGIFKYRNSEPENFIKHSGFLQFDLDGKDHTHIGNFDQLKKHLTNIQEVAYSGLSVSGRGYWGLVPIAYPERHKEQFLALCKAFKKLGLMLDTKPQAKHALRGYSYDPEGYFNFDAKVFTGLASDESDEVNTDRKDNRTYSGHGTYSDVEALIEKIQVARIDITADFNDWLRLGYAFAGEYGEEGREYFHSVSRFYSNYSESECNRIFNSCLRSNRKKVHIDSFFWLAKRYGILLFDAKENRLAASKHRTTAPYGFNPWTGEIFDERGYPKDWDEIGLPAPVLRSKLTA